MPAPVMPPDDFAACQALVIELASSLEATAADRDKLREELSELKLQIERLLQLLYGRRSERRTEDPQQQQLAFEEANAPITELAEEILQAPDPLDQALIARLTERRRKRAESAPRNEDLPEHLERRTTLRDLPAEDKAELTKIGEDVTERLRFDPPQLWVERIVRPKYVQKNVPAAGVFQLPPPLSIVESCRFDFSVIAQVVYAKYALHLPLYRQQDDFARLGWTPSRSTLCHLVGLAAETLSPLVEEFLRRLLAIDLLGIDETVVKLLTPDEERGSQETRAWLLRGLTAAAPYQVFRHFLSREQKHVDALLESFHGTLVADAYTAYEHIGQRSNDRIVHAACNAHARRKFVEAEGSSPLLAAQALAYYRRLYDVEERAKTLTAAERYALRQQESTLIWQELEAWSAGDAVRRLLPKNPLSLAVGYLQNHGPALKQYLTDGRVPIDNNEVEQALRALTIGRKNWLFLGSKEGGQRMATILSVVSSAHWHNLDVFAYLQEALRALAEARQHAPQELNAGSSLLTSLLPDVWAQAHPQHVRIFRQREREDVHDAKRLRRARRRLLEKSRAARA